MTAQINLCNVKNEKKGEIRAEVTGNEQKLFIYGDIVGADWQKWSKADTCPQDVLDLFGGFDKTKPVDICINSGGGDVFGALAICSVIGRHLGETRAHIDGIAASAASVIACACDTVDMPEYAQMMIHRPWTMAMGNADDLLKACDMLDAAEESIISIYRGKLADGKTDEDLRAALAAETWYSGGNIKDMFNVSVTQSAAAAAALSDYYGQYRNRPEPKPDPKEEKAKADKAAQTAAIQAVFEKFFK